MLRMVASACIVLGLAVSVTLAADGDKKPAGKPGDCGYETQP